MDKVSLQCFRSQSPHTDDAGKTVAVCSLSSPAPFSTDPVALEIRRQTDYSIRINVDEATSSRALRRVRVYADGIYDVFHSGHARQMLQIKQLVPCAYVIIGVINDEVALKYKGRTVMSEDERYEAARHCRYVDEVLKDAPWKHSEEFLTEMKIDLVAHDDLPYSSVDGSTYDPYQWIKSKGMFLPTQRTEGISTTDVISRIVRHYDIFVRRNLGKGCSIEELNVSFLQAKKIQTAGRINQLSAGTRNVLAYWQERSRDFVQGFMDIFTNPRASLNDWLMGRGRQVQDVLSPPASPTPDQPDGNGST